MAKQKKRKRYSFLFFRILGSISTPLVLLLVVFTFLLLRREHDNQQRYHELQSKSILQTLDIKFQDLMNDPEQILSPTALSQEVAGLEKNLDLELINIIDPTNEKSILKPIMREDGTERQPRELGEDAAEHIQKALTYKREGQGYYSVIDTKMKKFFGYVPIYDKVKKRVFVVTTELPILTLKDALTESYVVAWIAALMMILTTFFIAITLTARIVRPIQAINRTCQKMLSGHLGLQVSVKTGDEIESLSANFNRMSRTMLLMQRHASESNPLTKLPGNPQIMADIERRLKANEKFVFFHCDVDHFKAFNDAYGLARGDDVLRDTGKLMREALKEVAATNKESGNGFLGHQGGDDFVLIVSPWVSVKIAELVCKKFDDSMKNYYDEESLKKGYFEVEDTREQRITGESQVKKFPLMSISMAGISTVKNDFKNHQAILEQAISIKKKAKQIPYSSYVIDE